MRITIEMTEAESRSTAIHREIAGASMAGQAGPETPASDGGPPPEPLLLALGATTELGAEEVQAGPQGTDAGGPPAWLVDVITSDPAGRPA